MELLLIIVVSYLIIGLVSTSLIYYTIYKHDPESLEKRAESIGLTTAQYIIRSVLHATPVWIHLWYITIKNHFRSPLSQKEYRENLEKKLALIDRLRQIKNRMEEMTNIEEPTIEDLMEAKRLFNEFQSVKAQLEKEDY